MRTFDVDILTVPGWTGAGPDHWMSRWEGRLRTARRIEQQDRDQPYLAGWIDAIVAAVSMSTRPVVIVAHSCGIAAVVHAAARMPPGRVVGAYLVAPSSESEAMAIPGIGPTLAPYPTDPLPFPSVLIASRNDPHCGYDSAGEYALSWGSTLVDAGEVGHLNTESGHGPWPEGAMRLGLFLRHLGDVEAR